MLQVERVNLYFVLDYIIIDSNVHVNIVNVEKNNQVPTDM